MNKRLTDDATGYSDQEMILAIVEMLDGKEWNADTLGDIATLLQNAGYEIKDPND